MKHLAVAVLILTVVPQLALAQDTGYTTTGYYTSRPEPVQPESPFLPRIGLTAGLGLGVGFMSAESGPIDCFGCDYRPVAVGVDFHIGGMLNRRLALLVEFWGAGVPVDASGQAVLLQSMAFFAVQYWVTPKLWLKGGLGFARLDLSVDDGFTSDGLTLDEGSALMAAIGYEVMGTARFAMDLQFRLGVATYSTAIEDSITVGTFGLGFNWY